MKKEIAEKANFFFEKAFYNGDSLTYTEKHSNAISACGCALNFKNNIRNDNEALKWCKKGLEYEPDNNMLLELKRELEFKIDPSNYAIQQLKEKGWVK